MAGILNRPSPPIFVIDRESGEIVWVFTSPRAAEGAMEPPELNDDAYVVFDRFGHEATLGVDKWDVKIRAWSSEPSPDRLREALTTYVGGHSQTDPRGLNLEDLVADASRFALEEEYARTHPRTLVPVLKWLRRRRGEGSA